MHRTYLLMFLQPRFFFIPAVGDKLLKAIRWIFQLQFSTRKRWEDKRSQPSGFFLPLGRAENGEKGGGEASFCKPMGLAGHGLPGIAVHGEGLGFLVAVVQGEGPCASGPSQLRPPDP